MLLVVTLIYIDKYIDNKENLDIISFKLIFVETFNIKTNL